MAAKVYENGIWRDISTAKVYENGAYRDAECMKIYESGMWRDVWVNKKVLYEDGMVDSNYFSLYTDMGQYIFIQDEDYPFYVNTDSLYNAGYRYLELHFVTYNSDTSLDVYYKDTSTNPIRVHYLEKNILSSPEAGYGEYIIRYTIPSVVGFFTQIEGSGSGTSSARIEKIYAIK